MLKLNVRKRTYASGKYTYYYYFEGPKINNKRQRISKAGFKTKKEAEKAGKEALALFENAGKFINANISFADFVNKWINIELKITVSIGTQESYEKKIKNHIMPELGKYKLTSIRTATLQDLIMKLFQAGYSRNTISCIKGILSRIFDYAVSEQYIIGAQNPMIGVKMPGKGVTPDNPTRIHNNVFLNNEDINKIFARFPEGSSGFLPLLLCYRLGLRKGEAFGLAWEDIDFENKMVYIVRQVQFDKQKNCWCCRPVKYRHPRRISIDDELLEILKRSRQKQIEQDNKHNHYYKIYVSNYPSDYPENINRVFNSPIELSGIKGEGMREIEFVCIRDDGSYIVPDTTMHISRIIHDKLNIPDFTFHSLRHTHGSIMYNNCKDLTLVAKRLGHKNINVTAKYYIHSTDNDNTEEHKVINNMNMYKKEAIPK